MADSVGEEIEDALQLLVSTAEQSTKMKKELKQTILDTVSTLRNLIVKLQVSRECKADEISKLEKQVVELKSELNVSRQRAAKVLGTPSSEEKHELAGQSARSVAPQCGRDGKLSESDKLNGKTVVPSGVTKLLYSEALGSGKANKLFHLTVKSKGNTTQEEATELLKARINPTEIKVGINKFRVLNNGKIIIGTNTKQEIEALEKEITTKCGGELEATVHKLRKPRLIVYNIPEDISLQNIEDTLLNQNPDLGLMKGDIDAKFDFTTKNKNRNLVIEVEAKVRKILLLTKIKLGWHICKADDYIVATRCFRCSRYNHRHNECKGNETCPICAGAHRLKDCVADPKLFKCVNCTIYNKFNPHKNICTNHSSLDKKCPSMLAILERYRRNTEY
jgi:hypothetical protein